MNITFLGTSAGRPTAERNLSAIVLNLMQERHFLWLFDCGEATQMQMRKAKLSLSRLEMIFITHLHGDHLFGLPGVLTSRSLMQNQSPLTLIAPKGIKRFVETALEVSDSCLTYPLTIIEIEENGIVFEDHQFSVEVKPLEHRICCFGYRIIEKEYGKVLDWDKLEKDNIPQGAHYADLKAGKTVILDDGRMINGQDYMTEVKAGKKIAILGDTTPCQTAIELADSVDVIVHEATQEHALVEKALFRGHSTTVQAATVAKQANAKKLIITHISPRYSLQDKEKLVNECKTIFTNTEIATDLATFEV